MVANPGVGHGAAMVLALPGIGKLSTGRRARVRSPDKFWAVSVHAELAERWAAPDVNLLNEAGPSPGVLAVIDWRFVAEHPTRVVPDGSRNHIVPRVCDRHRDGPSAGGVERPADCVDCLGERRVLVDCSHSPDGRLTPVPAAGYAGNAQVGNIAAVGKGIGVRFRCTGCPPAACRLGERGQASWHRPRAAAMPFRSARRVRACVTVDLEWAHLRPGRLSPPPHLVRRHHTCHKRGPPWHHRCRHSSMDQFSGLRG